MPMLLTDMATEVARVIGGQNDPRVTDLATLMIKASLEDWQSSRKWNFLLKDTDGTVTLAGTMKAGATTFTLTDTGTVTAGTASAGDWDAVNIGDTVTLSVLTGSATLPASTTVTAYTRDVDGTVLSFTLSNPVTFTSGTYNLIRTCNIIMQPNTQEYNLPLDYDAPYNAYLRTLRRNLTFIKYREWNKKVTDQQTVGSIEAYTVYNPMSAATQHKGQYRLRVFRSAAQIDTLYLQYFRQFNITSTLLDLPDSFLYRLIDYAQWRLARLKNAEDTRLDQLEQIARQALQAAMNNDDSDLSEDEDIALMSQMDAWGGDKPIWNNGQFFPMQW